MRAKSAVLALVVCGTISMAAEAGHVSPILTRENGMNAVRLGGEKQTLLELIDRRSQAPERFDANHPRLGMALSLGLEGLLERQALNERRFNYWHPLIAHLLRDYTPDGPDLGGLDIRPRTPLVLTSTPVPQASSIGPVPNVVPEPASLGMVAAAMVVLAGAVHRTMRPRRSANP